jgi:hypothetical protein
VAGWEFVEDEVVGSGSIVGVVVVFVLVVFAVVVFDVDGPVEDCDAVCPSAPPDDVDAAASESGSVPA